jgi:hypothetical protein
MSNISFRIIPEINEKIEKTDGIWYSEDLIEVLISVSAHVAPWFTHRHLLPGQEIIHTSRSGDLLVISRNTHRSDNAFNEILDTGCRSNTTGLNPSTTC